MTEELDPDSARSHDVEDPSLGPFRSDLRRSGPRPQEPSILLLEGPTRHLPEEETDVVEALPRQVPSPVARASRVPVELDPLAGPRVLEQDPDPGPSDRRSPRRSSRRPSTLVKNR